MRGAIEGSIRIPSSSLLFLFNALPFSSISPNSFHSIRHCFRSLLPKPRLGRCPTRIGKVESEPGPITAEYRVRLACVTQDKTKRANKMMFLLLVRDQEVGGSNPLAPT